MALTTSLIIFGVSTVLSIGLSFAMQALQPKAKTRQEELQEGKHTTSNDGAAPRQLMLGTYRTGGSLVWWHGHGANETKATLVFAVSDIPTYNGNVISSIEAFGDTNRADQVNWLLIGDELVEFVPYGTDPIPGNQPDLDSGDWVPRFGDGAHKDWFRDITAGPGEDAIWENVNNKWKVRAPGSDLTVSAVRPGASQGNIGDAWYSSTSGILWYRYARASSGKIGTDGKRGVWTQVAFIDGDSGSSRPLFFQRSGPPNEAFIQAERKIAGVKYWHWEKGNKKYEWHVKARFYYGGQNVADDYLVNIDHPPESAKWESSAVGNAVAYAIVTFRYHPQIFASGFPPKVGFIVRGVRVYDPRIVPDQNAPTVTWFGKGIRANQLVHTQNIALNAALVACWDGLPGAVLWKDIDEQALIESADRCDDNVINLDGTVRKRYHMSGGVVSSDRRRVEEEQALEIAMGGEILDIGGKRVIRAGYIPPFDGGVLPDPVDLTIDKSNTFRPWLEQPWPEARDRRNTIIGNWDDPSALYTQVSVHPIRLDVDQDNDKGLEESVYLRYAFDRFHARQMGLILLRKMRKPMLKLKCSVECLDLIPGDRVNVNLPDIGIVNIHYEVTGMENAEILPQQNSPDVIQFDIFLRRWKNDTWDGPDEDTLVGNPDALQRWRPQQITSPQNLAFAAIPGDEQLDVEGFIAKSGILSWEAVDPSQRVRAYEAQYKLGEANFLAGGPLVSVPVEAGEKDWSPRYISVGDLDLTKPSVTLKGLRANAFYLMRARAQSEDGPWSEEMSDVEWDNTIEVILGATRFPGVADINQLGNLVLDGSFEKSAGLEVSRYWDKSRDVESSDGAVSFATSGGKTSPPACIIESGTTAIGKRIDEVTTHPVRSGELLRVGLDIRNMLGPSPGSRYAVYVNGRDLNKKFLVGSTVTVQDAVLTSNIYRRPTKIIQLPHGSYVPLDGGIENEAVTGGPGLTALFPTIVPSAVNRRGIVFAAFNSAFTLEPVPGGGSGGNAFSSGFSPGFGGIAPSTGWSFRARDVTTVGDDAGILVYDILLPDGEPAPDVEITQDVGTEWGTVGGAIGGSIQDPSVAPTFIDKGVASAALLGNTCTPAYPPFPIAGRVYYLAVAIHPVADPVCPAPSGWQLVNFFDGERLALFVFGKVAVGTETGTVTVAWNALGSIPGEVWIIGWGGWTVGWGGWTVGWVTGAISGNPVAIAQIYRYSGVAAEIAYADVQPRALPNGGSISKVAVDGIVMERVFEIPAIVNGAFIGVFTSKVATISGSRTTIAVTNYIAPPADGFVIEIEASFGFTMTRVLANSDIGNMEVWVTRARESDGQVVYLYGTDATTGVVIARYFGGSVSEDRYGQFGPHKVQDAVTPADGLTRNDRFRYRVLARMKSTNAATFEWGARRRNLKVSLTFSEFAAETGGDTEA